MHREKNDELRVLKTEQKGQQDKKISYGPPYVPQVYKELLQLIFVKTGTNTGWGIKISKFLKGHFAGCSGGREVGVVLCSWLASTVVSTHNGLDR